MQQIAINECLVYRCDCDFCHLSHKSVGCCRKSVLSKVKTCDSFL